MNEFIKNKTQELEQHIKDLKIIIRTAPKEIDSCNLEILDEQKNKLRIVEAQLSLLKEVQNHGQQDTKTSNNAIPSESGSPKNCASDKVTIPADTNIPEIEQETENRVKQEVCDEEFELLVNLSNKISFLIGYYKDNPNDNLKYIEVQVWNRLRKLKELKDKR